jgi:hypothetical protein
MTMQTLDRLVEFDQDVVKVDPGDGRAHTATVFTCPEARNRYFAFGCAPYGGRREHGGVIHADPFAFVYGCATVIDTSGHAMDAHRELVLHPGDRVFVKHYGFHTLELHRDGYNLRLVKDEAGEGEG